MMNTTSTVPAQRTGTETLTPAPRLYPRPATDVQPCGCGVYGCSG